MSKLITLLSFAALCGFSLLDKAPSVISANIRLGLAAVFTLALIELIRSEFALVLER